MHLSVWLGMDQLPWEQRRLKEDETTEVEAHMATYCLYAKSHQQQLYDSHKKLSITTVVKWLCISRDKGHPKQHL